MLRAVLLGLLSVTAVASCKKSEGTAASAVGVSAGKVLEVKGTVTVKHGDATKPLALNDTVEADDTVITGADGSVAIELSHNLVRWELGPNKQQKVRESIAFKAAKNTAPTANVEQDTAAAGRPAERSAVGTTVTAVEEEEKEDKAAPPPPPAAEAAPAPGAPADEGAAPEKKAAPSRRHSSRHRESAAKNEEAVALPSADEAMGGGGAEAPHEETVRATRGTRGAQITAKAAAPTAPMAPPMAQASSATASASGGGGGGGDAAAASLIAGKQSALKACLAGHADPVTLTVTVTGGHATVKLGSKSAVSASLDACVKKVVGSISFSGNAHAQTTIKP